MLHKINALVNKFLGKEKLLHYVHPLVLHAEGSKLILTVFYTTATVHKTQLLKAVCYVFAYHSGEGSNGSWEYKPCVGRTTTCEYSTVKTERH